LLAGLRLYDNGLLSLGLPGEFGVCHKGGAVTKYPEAERPTLDRFFGYTRLDTLGGEAELARGLKDLCARELWREQIDALTVVYAYSPYIQKFKTVLGRRVNVMAAYSSASDRLSFGCPLLVGSY
jgi:hypothetical protein